MEGNDLGRTRIFAKLDELSRLISSGPEQAVVFYAGHGMQVDNRNYLLPIDTGSSGAPLRDAILAEDATAAMEGRAASSC